MAFGTAQALPLTHRTEPGREKATGPRWYLGIVKCGKGVLKATSGPGGHPCSKLCSGLSEVREWVPALRAEFCVWWPGQEAGQDGQGKAEGKQGLY